MSKCEISIVFDRQDRTYAGGDPIYGRVLIQVNENVDCRGITLTHQWKTHGRGNIAAGPKETIDLAPARALLAGEELTLPFSLTAAAHPLTYRGHLINVDHYVSVDVDVPWAFNPKAKEEYLLLPGEPPAGFSGTRNAVISLSSTAQSAGPIVKGVLGLAVAIVIGMVAFFAIFFLPLILMIVGLFWMRRKALASRLGEVQVTIPHVIVAPGENWLVRIQFMPRKRFQINGIFLTLMGKELATSGSGTNQTTHTHKVLEQKLTIRSADVLEAGVPVDENFSLAFPETKAWSLELSDNKIQWTAEVRIDIPSFPDWSKTQPLQIVPMQFLRDVASVSAKNAAAALPSTDAPGGFPPSPPPLPAMSSPDDFADADREPTPAGSRPLPQDLQELATQIASLDRHGHQRVNLIGRVQGEIYDAIIVVDRINSTMGTAISEPQYQFGKTLTGLIAGTDQAIQVFTLESLNDEIDDLRRGDNWETQIQIDGWDGLYNRINARQLT